MGKHCSNPLPVEKPPQELVKDLADFFTQKIEKFCEELGDVPRYILHGTSESSLQNFTPAFIEQITILVNKMKPSTCGSDPLPPLLVKEHIDTLSPMITKIVNDYMVFFMITGSLLLFNHY